MARHAEREMPKAPLVHVASSTKEGAAAPIPLHLKLSQDRELSFQTATIDMNEWVLLTKVQELGCIDVARIATKNVRHGDRSGFPWADDVITFLRRVRRLKS